MKRALGPILAALFLACSGDRPLTPNAAPVFAISDGNHSLGNPDFFFLPPLVPNPSGNVLYQPALFNPDLVPVVDVCELSGDPGAGAVSCVRTAFGPVNAALDGGKYSVNWNTNASNDGAGLSVLNFYRIRVFGSSNGTLLGFADVDPVSTGKELKNIQTNEVIGLVDGRTLPINFSIEEGALCQPAGTASCTTETIVLADGGTVVLEETGDRVIVPPQPDRPGEVIALTLQPCDGDLPIDNPTAGPCLRVTADPPLVGPLTVRARVLLCSFEPEADLGGLTPEQADLLKVHRLDAGPPLVVQALPETPSTECFGGLGMEPRGLLERLGRLAFKLLAPREARASSLVLDVGEGGSTDFFSLFQLALPVKMQAATATELTGSPDEPVEPAPQVVVRDYNNDPVAGVRVHFAITSENGGSVTPVEVLSNADGHAGVSWVLGDAGSHTLRAYGWGIADPSNNGPQDGFDPFMPDITQPLADQSPASVGTGQILFHATAEAAVIGSWTPQGNLPAGRRDHTATLLPDGDVLIVGGTASGALFYNAANGQFLATEGAPLFNHGQGLTATRLADGRVLVVGGNGAPTGAEIYDPGTGAFTSVGPTLFSRIYHTATLLADGRVLLAAGNTDTEGGYLTHGAAEVFDPATNEFAMTGTLGVDRSSHGAVLLADGRVLVVGGHQSTSPGFANGLRSAEVWDPSSGAWTLLSAQLATPRTLPLVAMLGTGRVLIAGGTGGTSAELFNPATQTFSATGSASSVHSSGTLTLLTDGRALITGGVQSGGAAPVTLNVAEIYDPATGAWSAAANLVAARQQHTATLLQNGVVLVVGGTSFAAGDLSSSEFFSLVPPIP